LRTKLVHAAGAHAQHVDVVGPNEVVGQVLVEEDASERLLGLRVLQRPLREDVLEHIAVVDVDVADRGRAAHDRPQREKALGDEGRLRAPLVDDRLVVVEDRYVEIDRAVPDQDEGRVSLIAGARISCDFRECLRDVTAARERADLGHEVVVVVVRMCRELEQPGAQAIAVEVTQGQLDVQLIDGG
jgi:hypothetical protein